MTNELFTSFTLGLLATTSPCVLPLYPGFLAYLSGVGGSLPNPRLRPVLGFFVLAGILTTMVFLGLVITLLSVSIGKALSTLIPLADLAILTLGVLLMLNINPFKRLPQIQAPVLSHPFASAFLYGMLYAPIALPCSGPLVVGIFAFSVTAEQALSKLLIFLAFGLGFGLPLLVLAFLSGPIQRNLTRDLARHSRWINFAAGVLLVGVAVYDLVQNRTLIAAYF